MGLEQDMIDDIADITSNEDEFGASIILTSLTLQVANVVGLRTKHHLKLDTSIGQVVNSKNASVAISEKVIIAANSNYPVRGTNPTASNYQEVDMIGHQVEVADSSGVIKKYRCQENFADEELGLIILILQDLE